VPSAHLGRPLLELSVDIDALQMFAAGRHASAHQRCMPYVSTVLSLAAGALR
jgi:hypothetical protein